MFLAYAATLIDPALFNTLLDQDSQLVLPTLILRHTPVFAQILFFGAVLSAVMSCASATLLAPSVILSENVIKGALPRLSDREFLRVMRLVVVIFAVLVLTIALISSSSIYQLVVGTYEVTLVAAFVPLCAGLFWPRATTQGALCALAAGLTAWVGLELFGSFGSIWHPQLVGLFMAVMGMVVGSLLPQKIGTRPAREVKAGPV
jgi:Na+/proline symporter